MRCVCCAALPSAAAPAAARATSRHHVRANNGSGATPRMQRCLQHSLQGRCSASQPAHQSCLDAPASALTGRCLGLSRALGCVVCVMHCVILPGWHSPSTNFTKWTWQLWAGMKPQVGTLRRCGCSDYIGRASCRASLEGPSLIFYICRPVFKYSVQLR